MGENRNRTWSEPFTNIPGSVSDIFKEPFQKYKLEQNHDVMEACKEFIQNEESKINVDEVLGNINYGEWLDKPEELQDLTKRILDRINVSERFLLKSVYMLHVFADFTLLIN